MKTIVLGLPRSGTTRIILLLRKHFNDEYERDEFVSFEKCTERKSIKDLKTEFLKNEHHRFDIHKLVIYHLTHDNEEEPVLDLSFIESLLCTYDKVIYTLRANIFERILSHAIAVHLSRSYKNSSWYHYEINNPDKHFDNPYQSVNSKLTIDLELIETLCFQHKFSEPAEKLILASPKTIVVNYEDSVSLNSTEVLSLVGVENRFNENV
jgi:hypothetical protein